MQNIKLILIGEIYAISKKTFEDKETVSVQFLNKLENGGVEIVQVKLTNESDIKTVKENNTVKIPVKVSSYQGKLYYTQCETFLKQ